ncbi:type II toxin-antitoxin system YafQ family toxin [Corynebacterium sp. 153RC1]|uniref:type II toxin-antitoxin system YafQ family toxin n=1 Tax=unclassified Corynebacterium TaxID=2624378 RepID=UPI00211C797E|nr:MULTISPECIES: type II toxin-antitoxin system YafQ family toxin [unclassified Corynebacterium]MCQ9370827.1 type II toxin-antitoxin system YafQ family toxin [Corynebacterium sp. 35RC1]MCQ9353509.1 type II toxin-antitoxin system YafQ family toxin [Corynebacterium sp. 209RC1]MCQ9355123.1 type II toxin-antitoxin system YafQ family toxin [Corynebacterium sp. 1222RC1]MCQ9357248.1 type II toxin-antitoxin system YafQ family toxin [Corynebacterium sp. 122RC1]MCQ9359423.1 type II toxin-antitoxin syste
MTNRLTAKFTSAFSRDLKKKATKRHWDLAELEALIDLVLDNSLESQEILK